MRTSLFLVGLGFTMVPAAALAQTPPGTGARQDSREIRQDNRELRQDQHQARDDRADRARFANLLREYDAAIAGNRAAELTGLDQRVMANLGAEVREGNREQAQKNAEVARSEAERRRSRREAAADVGAGRPGVTAGDRRDLRDDRRDARDDRRDAAREGRQDAQVDGIRAEYAALVGQNDRPALDKKRALIARMVAIQGAEVREGQREQVEDRRERREDRRERREDRRGR